MNDASRALEALTPEQVAAYRRDGYLVLEGRVSPEVIAACHAEIARLKDSARGLTGHTEALDLEDSHTPEAPRIRRVKLPHKQGKVFDDLMRSDAILAPVRDHGPCARRPRHDRWRLSTPAQSSPSPLAGLVWGFAPASFPLPPQRRAPPG